VRLLSRRSAVFLFFIITGVPIALLAYFSIKVSTASAISQAEKNAADSAEATAVFVHQRFQNVAEQLDSFAGGALTAALGGGEPARYDVPAMEQQLTQLIQARSGFDTAFVTDLRGQLVAIAPKRNELLGSYFTGEDWYQGVREQTVPYVGGLSAAAAQQALNSVAIAAPIRGSADQNGIRHRMAYMVGIYNLGQIQALINDFARTRGTALSLVDSG